MAVAPEGSNTQRAVQHAALHTWRFLVVSLAQQATGMCVDIRVCVCVCVCVWCMFVWGRCVCVCVPSLCHH